MGVFTRSRISSGFVNLAGLRINTSYNIDFFIGFPGSEALWPIVTKMKSMTLSTQATSTFTLIAKCSCLFLKSFCCIHEWVATQASGRYTMHPSAHILHATQRVLLSTTVGCPLLAGNAVGVQCTR